MTIVGVVVVIECVCVCARARVQACICLFLCPSLLLIYNVGYTIGAISQQSTFPKRESIPHSDIGGSLSAILKQAITEPQALRPSLLVPVESALVVDSA